jgi:hypothetical protein
VSRQQSQEELLKFADMQVRFREDAPVERATSLSSILCRTKRHPEAFESVFAATPVKTNMLHTKVLVRKGERTTVTQPLKRKEYVKKRALINACRYPSPSPKTLFPHVF